MTITTLENGDQILVPGPSPLKARLDAALSANQAAHQEIQDAHAARVEVKCARQSANRLPPEKSSC